MTENVGICPNVIRDLGEGAGTVDAVSAGGGGGGPRYIQAQIFHPSIAIHPKSLRR